MRTDIVQIRDLEAYAQQLYSEMGPRSVAVAARRAAEAASEGKEEHAQRWRRVERTLIGLRNQHRN